MSIGNCRLGYSASAPAVRLPGSSLNCRRHPIGRGWLCISPACRGYASRGTDLPRSRASRDPWGPRGVRRPPCPRPSPALRSTASRPPSQRPDGIAARVLGLPVEIPSHAVVHRHFPRHANVARIDGQGFRQKGPGCARVAAKHPRHGVRVLDAFRDDFVAKRHVERAHCAVGRLDRARCKRFQIKRREIDQGVRIVGLGCDRCLQRGHPLRVHSVAISDVGARGHERKPQQRNEHHVPASHAHLLDEHPSFLSRHERGDSQMPGAGRALAPPDKGSTNIRLSNIQAREARLLPTLFPVNPAPTPSLEGIHTVGPIIPCIHL